MLRALDRRAGRPDFHDWFWLSPGPSLQVMSHKTKAGSTALNKTGSMLRMGRGSGHGAAMDDGVGWGPEKGSVSKHLQLPSNLQPRPSPGGLGGPARQPAAQQPPKAPSGPILVRGVRTTTGPGATEAAERAKCATASGVLSCCCVCKHRAWPAWAHSPPVLHRCEPQPAPAATRLERAGRGRGPLSPCCRARSLMSAGRGGRGGPPVKADG